MFRRLQHWLAHKLRMNYCEPYIHTTESGGQDIGHRCCGCGKTTLWYSKR